MAELGLSAEVAASSSVGRGMYMVDGSSRCERDLGISDLGVDGIVGNLVSGHSRNQKVRRRGTLRARAGRC